MIGGCNIFRFVYIDIFEENKLVYILKILVFIEWKYIRFLFCKDKKEKNIYEMEIIEIVNIIELIVLLNIFIEFLEW